MLWNILCSQNISEVCIHLNVFIYLNVYIKQYNLSEVIFVDTWTAECLPTL